MGKKENIRDKKGNKKRRSRKKKGPQREINMGENGKYSGKKGTLT